MGIVSIPVHLPSDVLEELSKFSGYFWSDWRQEPIICEAIRAYIKPAPPVQQLPAATADEGYQWKQVFLPAGTRLRANFGRESYFAVVAGAEIKYDKHAISPSCFANLYGSGNRNAWKAVWLLFPNSAQWVLADVCRSLQKAAVVRLFQAPQESGQIPKTAP